MKISSSVLSCHAVLSARKFYGTFSIRYEAGTPVLIRFEETVKPRDLAAYLTTVPAGRPDTRDKETKL